MLEINVKITLAPGEEYSAIEAAVAQALSGSATPAAPAAPAKPVAAAKAPAAPAPASKPAAATKPPVAKTPAAKAPAKAVEPEPEEEVEDEGPAAALEVEEDLLGGDEPAYTIEAAVAAATKLVSAGKSADVKAALAASGAKKVSELKGKGIQAFIEALEG